MLAPPMERAFTRSEVKVRLRMLVSAPRVVAKLAGAAPARMKNTSSADSEFGVPGVPWLKSGEEDQLVPPGPLLGWFQMALSSPTQ